MARKSKEETYQARLSKIAEITLFPNWYFSMASWRRKELTQEELYQYAEEMREIIDYINDLCSEFNDY